MITRRKLLATAFAAPLAIIASTEAAPQQRLKAGSDSFTGTFNVDDVPIYHYDDGSIRAGPYFWIDAKGTAFQLEPFGEDNYLITAVPQVTPPIYTRGEIDQQSIEAARRSVRSGAIGMERSYYSLLEKRSTLEKQ